MSIVAILTFHRSPNYGAVLQAYALQQTIAKLGFDCEILDLLRPVHTGYRKTNRNAPLVPYAFLGNNKPIVSSRQKVKGSVRALIDSFLTRKSKLRFRQFDQSHLIFSEQSFCCSDDLYGSELDYDCYVTGSDQVWNPTYPYSPEPYFLTFAAKGIPRIAYAPSFGVSEIHKGVHPQYRQWLNEINHLSVRETHGAEIVRQLTGRDAQVVLDPTLLLTSDEWRKIAIKPNINCPYIFCYSLGDVPGLKDLCYHIQRDTGYPIYKIGNTKDLLDQKVHAVLDAGPQEFLGYIMNAAIVVTNSFHGTVLSINMQKPFYTVLSPVTGATSRNSRLLSTLELFSLGERLYGNADELPSSADYGLGYEEIEIKLAVEREKSLSYLKNSMCSGKL